MIIRLCLATAILFVTIGCEPQTIVTTNLTSPTSPSSIIFPQNQTQTPTQSCTTTPTGQLTCPPCTTGNCNGQNDQTSRRAPEILNFGADSIKVRTGGAATLRWEISDINANVRIDPGIGSVGTVGFALVFPQETTTYTLTARNSLGIAQRQLTIYVFNN